MVEVAKGRPDTRQSLMLDRFIEGKGLERRKVSEEFPVGIRRAYKEVNEKPLEGGIHEHLTKNLYKFGPYADDVEMLNSTKFDWTFGRQDLSNAFGFLTYDGAKAIDAVYINGKEAWIVEIKTDKADKKAMEQVTEYADLFKEDYLGFGVIKRVIITDKIDRAVKSECQKSGIEIYEASRLEKSAEDARKAKLTTDHMVSRYRAAAEKEDKEIS